jgi:PAS domain S-box-containing protein
LATANSCAAIPVDILVVEDRPADRTALRAMLTTPEYTLVEASSGPEALRKLLTSDFAVLLLDVVMPEMSGFEVATMVRQRERTASLPIIFMTGEGSDVAFVYRGYRTGAVDYLIKPLVPEIVRAKVAVFVELYRQRRLLVEAEHQNSELRIAELRLASERHYRQLAETVPDIIWMANADGKVDYLNQRWFEYTGVSAEQSSSAGWRPALHPDDAAPIDGAWNESIRTGCSFEMQARLRASDGSYRWHLARAVAERRPGAQIVCWLGTFTDIEDQKRIEEVLSEFKGTLDAVLDAVLIFHPVTLEMQYVNRGASLLTNRSQRELLALRPFDLLVDFDEQRFREFLAPVREGADSVVSAELLWHRRGAVDVPVDASFQLVLIDGTRIVCIARDATERRLAELEREQLYNEAVAAVRVRDDFLSVASHELRTPLTTLQLHLDGLKRARNPAQAPLSADYVNAKIEAASRQVSRLTRLVAELLDVTRMGAGSLQIEPVEVDLVSVARGVIGRLAEEAERAGSLVTLHAGEGVVGRWDAMRMEQVVTNLLSNALKFGAGKPVEVAVEREGRLARISVRDHGIGIAREDIDRIFMRFERAVSRRHYGGFGLGLYIVYQIAEAHGGRVRAESTAGDGATFIVELPLERPISKEEKPGGAPIACTGGQLSDH